MRRAALERLRRYAPVVVTLEHGRRVRALYHSHEIEGRGRRARTYVRVLLSPGDRPVRVYAGRVEALGDAA